MVLCRCTPRVSTPKDLLQEANAISPMLVTELGIAKEVNGPQAQNDLLPMITELGIVKLLMR